VPAGGVEMVVRIVEICSIQVFVAYPDQALAAAAREMCAREVGALVVVAPGDRRQCPIGILTDRDIVRGE
jgi:predicted transcriptional regulator